MRVCCIYCEQSRGLWWQPIATETSCDDNASSGWACEFTKTIAHVCWVIGERAASKSFSHVSASVRKLFTTQTVLIAVQFEPSWNLTAM